MTGGSALRAGWMVWLGLCALAPSAFGAELRIGSKAFTESVILAEMAAALAAQPDLEVRHLRQLGGTRILWRALEHGDIDVYPEYTGTLRQEILAAPDADLDRLRQTLAARGIGMSAPLGFDNRYAIGMQREVAERLGIERISDLRRHPRLRFGFSNEFMDRSDGWPGLRDHYRLPQTTVRGLDHDLAYRGLTGGDLDAMELYSTDAEIAYYDLRILEDDEGFFPRYQAVLLYRLALAEQSPRALQRMRMLEGAVNDSDMIAMNAAAKLERRPAAAIAGDFVRQRLQVDSQAPRDTGAMPALLGWTLQHLALVGISLSMAIVVALPLGIVAARRPRLGQWLLSFTGLLQTIPSLALFVFMIPLLGIGAAPAIAALFLYSLLPIVRNTHAGLTGIEVAVRESAEVLGLPAAARLRLIELPLSAPTILAGIKTSAVINVGTATLGALIGAGGYGQPILTGIRLDDMNLILQGAVPAAVLALLVQGLFEWAERKTVPEGLRAGPPGSRQKGV